MTYQHPPGFEVPNPSHNDPLTPEYIGKMVRQIMGLVDGLIDPILNAEMSDAEKTILLDTHLLNATLIFHKCVADRYYDLRIEDS